MITRLYIDNFKSFVNFELTAKSLNLLLGANGSGKSSMFEILVLLQKFIQGETASKLFTINSLTRWQLLNIQTLELEIGSYQYRLEIEHQVQQRQSHVKLRR